MPTPVSRSDGEQRSGGRIGGGQFVRRGVPLSLLLMGLGALAWAALSRPVVVHQEIRQEIHQAAPEQVQVFNAPVKVHVEQHLPEELGQMRSSAVRHQAVAEADALQEQAVREALLQLQSVGRGHAGDLPQD
ncbi:MAG: hypothetical protein FJ054_11195 [Cyanobacteria bacterium M_surface_10_m2_119]|nr:hypothetical protein [Cyanobacteria bacterium M_surface_10_m2_119]